jgi:thioredoxin-like negative regulator of GroEL
MAQWVDIYEEEQFDDLVQHGPVIVLFGSSSNMAWNAARMPIQGLASSPVIPPFVKVLHVDKDQLPQIAQKRNVKTVPTARFLLDGKQMSELTGDQVTPENIHRNFDKMMQAAH